MEEELQSLKKQLGSCQKKYYDMKQRFVEEHESRLSNKLQKASNKFWSVIAVFMMSGEGQTSFTKKVGMFFKTMWAWARSGFKLEDKQTAQARFEICRACPYLTNTNQCEMCGCFMKKKVQVSGASCPLNKW